MRGAVSLIYMARNREYQVPVFNIGQPDPDVVKGREAMISRLKEEMGAKYILHPDNGINVKPSANSNRLL